MSRCSFGLVAAVGVLLPYSLLAADLAKSTAPRCALLDPEKLDRAAILEAKLTADPAATWVERNAIDQVLKEQQVQALSAANGVGERARLGRLLKADVLVMVRRAKGVTEPTIEVTVSETAGGLRLLVRGAAESKDAGADVEALRMAVADGLKKYGETVRDVVAVPPFVSNNLTYENDYLKSAFAKLIEQVALNRPGVVAVELAEAEALAKELALAADVKINRPLPLYVIGEFRHEGRGAEQTATVKLRAERGGKPIGKPAELKVKPDAASAVVRAWTSETLDTVAVDKTRRPPADGKAEAKRLGELAANHRRLGNWEEALALLEAGLLLDPDQFNYRADAIEIMLPLLRELSLKAADRQLDAVAAHLRIHRRGLDHLEAIVEHNRDLEAIVQQRAFAGSLSGLFASVGNLIARTPETIAARENSLTHQREALSRLIPRVAKSDLPLVEASFVNSLFSRLPPRERYLLLEKVLFDIQEAPGASERSVRYILAARQANFLVYPRPKPQEETAALEALLNRLKGAKNTELQKAAAAMEQRIADEIKPPDKVAARDPVPEGLVLRPAEFVFEEGGQRVDNVHDILAVGPGVDLAWVNGVLFLMKEKGKLRSLPAIQKMKADFGEARYDGKYVWATGLRPQGGLVLAIIDPRSEQVWEVAKTAGLPQPSEEQLKSVVLDSLLLGPIEPGRAAIVGVYGGRTWVAIAKFDPKTGKTEVKVIHEAREAEQVDTDEKNDRTTITFRPTYVAAIAGAPGPDGRIERRLLVGRSGRTGPVLTYPLLVDPDRQTVVVMKDRFPSMGTSSVHSRQLGMSDDAVYFLESEGHLPPNTARVFRFGFPDLTKKPVGKVLTKGELFASVVSAGRFYCVRGIHEALPKDKPLTPGVYSPTKIDWELWSMDLDGKESRRLGVNLPQVMNLAHSSHYGLVAFVAGRFPARHELQFRTIEFTEPAKK